MPRPTNKLTDAQIRGASPAERTFKLADGEGMFCEVTPSGARRWRLKYRYGGKERLLSLGTYPGTSLAAARAKRDACRRQLDQGLDPSAERRREKAAQAASAASAFADVAREWYEHKHRAEVVASHAARNLRRLEQHVFPTLGRRPVAEITAPEVLEPLRRIERKGHIETAHRVKTLVSQVMRYAVATGRAERDVTADLRDALKAAKPNHHAAIVDPDELGGLLRAIDTYSGQPATCAALKLAPLVALRPGELRTLRWDCIDWDNAQATVVQKGGSDLIVPLSRQALEILREIEPLSGRGEFLFPSARGGGRPLSDMTINAALAHLGYGERMKAHGWRAAFRTLAVERLGAPVEIVEMQLGHRVRDVHGKAYNRTQWLTERAEWMQRWADYLDRLREQNKAKVLPMPERQRVNP